MHGSLDDVLALGRELLEPTVVAGETLGEMRSVQFPGLVGVLPDFGRFDPLDLGARRTAQHLEAVVDGDENIGAHIRPFRPVAHFLWVDPVAGVACAALANRRSETGQRWLGRSSDAALAS